VAEDRVESASEESWEDHTFRPTNMVPLRLLLRYHYTVGFYYCCTLLLNIWSRLTLNFATVL